MTIISTHRNHTYKASTPVKVRNISPKRVHTIKMTKSVKPLNKANTGANIKPSAPPVEWQTRTIWVWGNEYNVQLPQYFDEYEGLRLYYPNLYIEVCKETNTAYTDITYTDDDIEEAFDYYDYLEWLYD